MLVPATEAGSTSVEKRETAVSSVVVGIGVMVLLAMIIGDS
jgi:hypothetical protein